MREPTNMDGTTDRRTFLTGGAVMVASGLGLATPKTMGAQERPPALPDDLVFDFVRAAHGDLDRTRAMLDEEPGLLNATWDWGGGDFETALGGASHMGNREIAALLLSRGARIDIFCAATMGMLDTVRTVVDAYPDAVLWEGPHGISLLRHAQAGGSDRVVTYLESMGPSG